MHHVSRKYQLAIALKCSSEGVKNALGTVFQSNSILTTTQDFIHFTAVKSLSNQAFGSCSHLTHIIFPPSVESSGQNVNQHCTRLLLWISPPNYKSGANNTFYNCRALKAIIFNAITPPSVPSGFFSYRSGRFYVPDDSVEAYKAASGWSSYASSIYGHSQLAIDYPDYYEQYIHIYD